MGLIVVMGGERAQRFMRILLIASSLMLYASLANATPVPAPAAAPPAGGPYPAPSTQENATASDGGPTTLAPSSAAEAMASGGGDSFVSLLATIVGCVAFVAMIVLGLVWYLRQRWGKRRGPEPAVEEARSGPAGKFASSVLPSIGSFEEIEGDGGGGQITSNPLYASSGRSVERPLSASARTAIGTDCGGDFKDVEDSSPIGGSSAPSNWSSLGWKSTTAPVAPKGKGISVPVKGYCGSSSSSSSGRGSDGVGVGVGVGGGAFAREAGSVDELTRKKKKLNATTEMLDTVGPAFLIRPPPWPDRGGGISGWRDSTTEEGGGIPWSSASTIARGRGACRAASPTNSSVTCNSDYGGRPKTTARSVSRGSSSSPRNPHDFGATNGGSKRPNLERVLSDSGRYFPHRGQPLTREGRTLSSSSSTSRRQTDGSGSGDCGEASIPTRAAERVVAAAEALSAESIIPLVRESAVVAAALSRIAAERHGKAREIERRVRWCRALVRMLERAGEVLGQATAHDGETERLLLENVRECVADVMEIVRAYKSTASGLSKVFESTLCTRRRREADEAIDVAQQRLEVIMQVRAGNVVNTLGQHGDGGSYRQEKTFKEILAQSKKKRRQRRLDRLEISAEDIDVTDEVLGSGGFGTVYLADFDGLNAAAKVVVLDTDANADSEDAEYRDQFEGAQGACEEHLRKWSEEEYSDRASSGDGLGGEQRALSEARRCQVFMREVEALKRMRDPNVVEIYGGVVSVKDCLILVMELLPAGSLRHRLKKARKGLSERALSQIVLDMCSGMAYLHAEAFVHGSLKSTNVLFDASGRAKISDYGALLWAQHTPKLETCSGAQNGSIGVNLRWSAPEILNRERATQKTDVYSFGVVVWECLTRQLPWADLAGVDMLLLAVTGGERPTIPSYAPVNLAALTKACWAHDPASRPTFKRILADLRHTEKGVGVGVGGGTSVSASLWPWSAWSSTPGAGEVSDSGTPKTAAGERTASPESLQVLNAAARAGRSDGGTRGGGGAGGGGILWPFVSRRKTDGSSRSLSSLPATRRGGEKASQNEGQGSGGSTKLDGSPVPDRDLPALFRRLREEKARVNCLSSGEDSPLEPQPVVGR